MINSQRTIFKIEEDLSLIRIFLLSLMRDKVHLQKIQLTYRPSKAKNTPSKTKSMSHEEIQLPINKQRVVGEVILKKTEDMICELILLIL